MSQHQSPNPVATGASHCQQPYHTTSPLVPIQSSQPTHNKPPTLKPKSSINSLFSHFRFASKDTKHQAVGEEEKGHASVSAPSYGIPPHQALNVQSGRLFPREERSMGLTGMRAELEHSIGSISSQSTTSVHQTASNPSSTSKDNSTHSPVKCQISNHSQVQSQSSNSCSHVFRTVRINKSHGCNPVAESSSSNTIKAKSPLRDSSTSGSLVPIPESRTSNTIQRMFRDAQSNALSTSLRILESSTIDAIKDKSRATEVNEPDSSVSLSQSNTTNTIKNKSLTMKSKTSASVSLPQSSTTSKLKYKPLNTINNAKISTTPTYRTHLPRPSPPSTLTAKTQATSQRANLNTNTPVRRDHLRESNTTNSLKSKSQPGKTDKPDNSLNGKSLPKSSTTGNIKDKSKVAATSASKLDTILPTSSSLVLPTTIFISLKPLSTLLTQSHTAIATLREAHRSGEAQQQAVLATKQCNKHGARSKQSSEQAALTKNHLGIKQGTEKAVGQAVGREMDFDVMENNLRALEELYGQFLRYGGRFGGERKEVWVVG